MEKSAKPWKGDMFQPGGEDRRDVTPGKGIPHNLWNPESGGIK
jgi:hypothetical protein